MSWNSFMRPTLTDPHMSKIQANKSNPQILRDEILSANFVFGRFVSYVLNLREFLLLTWHFIGKKITRQA